MVASTEAGFSGKTGRIPYKPVRYPLSQECDVSIVKHTLYTVLPHEEEVMKARILLQQPAVGTSRDI